MNKEEADLCAPLRLVPKQQPVIWGGSRLHDVLAKPASDEPIGESWEVWEGNRVESGHFAGEGLQKVVDLGPSKMLGSIPLRLSGARFPLLTKFIDAHQPLSVQVHPDDSGAQRLEDQPNGKTEAWYIVEATDDAWIIHGLTREIDKDTFRHLLEAGEADDVLRKITPKPRQTIFVPAGTVHAIGPGVLLHEVQQTSDVTYRLYDWNRKKPRTNEPARELHLDKGLEVASLHPSRDGVVKPLGWQDGSLRVDVILASRYFTVKRMSLPGELDLDTHGISFHILTVIAGSTELTAGPEVINLRKGQSLVLPACLGSYRVSSTEDATILVEYLSDVQEELVPEMRSHGLGQDEIEEFLAQFAPLGA